MDCYKKKKAYRLFIDYKNLYIYSENYPQGHTIFINIHLLMKSYKNTHES